MILTSHQLLGHDPTLAWSARVALLCPGESVSAVYAVEAWATGERESVVAYYVRAAWGWR